MHQIDKHRRELSIPGVCRHHTLKRCHVCMHSQLLLSSPLVSTNTTISNSSVVGGRQCSRHSVSQSAVSQTRRMCVLRSLSPAPADQPISKLICSRGQFHKVSCNSIQQTARKADCRHHGNVTGMENYTTDGKT
jgi:hypothetical protein